ncbi:MAG: hypothetical protein RIB30_18925 [Thalassospira sp.]|uniref:hypothetical protein n=1 Tax=Thalassospira sp. TaxID=1912094 RepID=UPI0032EAB195
MLKNYRFRMWFLSGVLVLLAASFLPAHAETFRVPLIGDAENGPFAYQYKLLRLALDHSGETHQIEFIDHVGTPASRIMELMDAGDSDVMFTGYSLAWEQKFAQVDFPLTRGILGHRIFATRGELSGALDHVRNVEELKHHCIGSGTDWPDTKILEANGFCVEKAAYQNLWQMLSHSRFDFFNRGAHEVYSEVKQAQEAGENVIVEEHILLVYPMDFFFYVRADDAVRHEILTTGLKNAYESGAFMRNFYSDIGIAKALRAANDDQRVVFRLENPFMSESTLHIAPDYWEMY